MAAPLGLLKRAPYQVAPDAAFAKIGRNRQRTEEQGGAPGTGGDIPKPHRADHASSGAGDERQSILRQPVLTQPLGRLAEATIAERAVEQRLAPCVIEGSLVTNCDH